MKRREFRLFHRLSGAEVETRKTAFNARCLAYFDIAVDEYWRALALPYEEALPRLGGELYARKASLDYHGSAHFDERLDMALACRHAGTSSMIFSGAVFRGDDMLAACKLVYVFADPLSQTPKPVPQALRSAVGRFESGQPVLDIRAGDWAELATDATKLRVAVFVQEQGISQDLEWDGQDDSAHHVVASNFLGQPVGTARLTEQAAKVGRIGRMAVHRALRGTGIGTALLQELVNMAKRRGDVEIMLHAQCSAEGFYRGQGFIGWGDPFEEAGIAHIEMKMKL